MKRYNSAFSLLVFGFFLVCTSLSAYPLYEVAKVGYSLPESPNFNNSLKKDVLQMANAGRGPIWAIDYSSKRKERLDLGKNILNFGLITG